MQAACRGLGGCESTGAGRARGVLVTPSDLLRAAAELIATLVEAAGVVVVAVAVALAVARYVGALVRRAQPFPPQSLRLDLGRSLALALELPLSADNLRTAVDPSWEEIGRLRHPHRAQLLPPEGDRERGA